MFTIQDPSRDFQFNDLAAIEPKLIALRNDARDVALQAANDHCFCQHRAWYKGYGDKTAFKNRVAELVGLTASRKDWRLRSDAAWIVVLNELLDVLPGCRACTCAIP